jgi:hypothetical protein
MPVQAKVLPDGNYYLPASDETIPADMATPSPDDRFHHCIYYPRASEFDPWDGKIWESKAKTRCLWRPFHTKKPITNNAMVRPPIITPSAIWAISAMVTKVTASTCAFSASLVLIYRSRNHRVSNGSWMQTAP